MAQENVDQLRANYEAFNRTGEINLENLAPDFEMHQATSIIDTAGVFHGRNALRDSLSELRESFEELSFEAEEFIEAPDGEIVVFIRARGRGRGSGMEIDNAIVGAGMEPGRAPAQVRTFRDDMAIRLVVYEEQTEALKAVGLRE